MKLIQASLHRFSFYIGRNEQQMFMNVLELYPLVPVSYHKLSRSLDRPEDQQSLDEALAAQRATHRNRLDSLIKAPGFFSEYLEGYQFSLTAAQIEWLLQVLNDISVGCWLSLGSPQKMTAAIALLNEKNIRYAWTMELAMVFQVTFIAAISDGSKSSPPNPPDKA